MRGHIYVLCLTLLLCLASAKPIDEAQPSDVATPETSNTVNAEKRDDITEAQETSEDDDESKTTDQQEADEAANTSQVEEENTITEEGAKKDTVLKAEENLSADSEASALADTENSEKKEEIPRVEEDSQPEEEEDNETEEDADKKEIVAEVGEKRHHEHDHHRDHDHHFHHGGHHEHEGGDHDEHHNEHGHHHHDHHEHDHHHHDHGYEFYEEWGEHGGHEGEHHGHDEGEHHHEHKGHHKGKGQQEHGYKKTIARASETHPNGDISAKKWWMVGDHWGGWGKDHWGCPHIEHESGGWQYCHHGLRGSQHGQYKSVIPDCCKFANPTITKRCGCHGGGGGGGGAAGGGKVPPGYHFHDHGSGHNNHDHELQGAWTFGYDHFGDDWHDWDHNTGNFEHLQHMDHSCQCGHGRACVPLVKPSNCVNYAQAASLPIPISIAPGPVPIVQANVPVMRPATVGAGAVAVNALTPIGPVAFATRRPNRVVHVCHDCQNLPYGGSRCLCKNVRQPVNAIVPQYQRHVYIDCDSAVHKFPFQTNCVARTDLPVPKRKKDKTGKAKQGVVYPYVGYGPWAAYPWTADWWGGQGRHGWGDKGCAQGSCRDEIVLAHHHHHHKHHEHHHESHHDHHGHHHHHHHKHHSHHDHHDHHGHHHHHKHHEHHSGHHHDHHGHHHHHHGHHHHGHHHHGHHHGHHHHKHHEHHHESHHDHHGHHHHHKHHHHSHHDHHHGHHFINNDHEREDTANVQTNMPLVGLVNGKQLTAYHCHDVVDSSSQNSKAKRFCVPIGYKGGYGWPYWHGYPGVGTGLWGWGWPWIKNKVPGSKGSQKGKETVAEQDSNTATPADSTEEDKTATRSIIPAPTPEQSGKKSTKKQTIHVGYGYASGDNYRLGYGMGGMGGVAGFTGGASASNPNPAFKKKSNIPKIDATTKTNIPTPESPKDVNASKRNIGYNQPTANGVASSLGHPVTHPGFTTVGYPGHGNSETEVIKDKIPITKNSNAEKRIL